MLLALAATALVAIALLSDLIIPRLDEAWSRHRAHRRRAPALDFDPGRERRAEQRARELLRSCVNEEEWAMYRDLGFIRVWGSQAHGPGSTGNTGGAAYAYLIYPHRPIVAYLAQTRRLLNEYCVEFPDRDTSVWQRSPTRLRRRARQVDGADRGRAPADLHRQHAPPRAPARPEPGASGPLATRAMGAGQGANARAQPSVRARRPDAVDPPRPRASPRETRPDTVSPPMSTTSSSNGQFDLKHRSRALTEGPERAAARAYLKGIGYDDEALAKPLIGVANTWIETMPCNFHLRALAAKVKEGIRAAGGTPMELNTIAISDGITMGTAGMKASLAEPRGDRRLDRACLRRPPVRCGDRDQRLRQDDPRQP